MKTTLDIKDDLMLRAKRLAQRSGQPLRALVEEGLHRVLEASEVRTSYVLPDRSVGDPRDTNPLEGLSWPELRAAIYGDTAEATPQQNVHRRRARPKRK